MNLTKKFYINLFFIVTFTLFFVSAFYVTNSVAKDEMDLYGDMLEDDMINPFEGDEEAIAIGYDSFFREKTGFNGSKVDAPELNSLSEFILRISNEVPFLYGAFAIILAVVLGALMAWFRKIIHDLRYKKPKQEEVKFPVK